MDLPLRPAAPSTFLLRDKPTLTTLPIEIKNEIFSYFLLGKNVKYFKPGTIPAYAYAFQMNVTRTSKQLYKEANEYLQTHNDFALIHMKYPRLMRDFCPYVAVGKEARSFKSPAIEATIEDLEPKAIHPDYDLSYCAGSAKPHTERILLLAQDLPHFCRQLQLEIHVWPSSQIYVHPDETSTPIQYSSIIVKNGRKVVWKVNASHRSDLTLHERRTRQQSLISSISTVVGHGLDIRFLGVEQDIAARAIAYMTPRIVSVDASGWNLLENMQRQKRYLDESLVRGPQGSQELRRGYIMVAQLVETSRSYLPTIVRYNTAFLFNTPYRRPPPPPLSMASFQNEIELAAKSSPWMRYVYTTALECLLNAMSLALDDNDLGFLVDTSGLAWVLGWFFQCQGALPQELHSLALHYNDWRDLFRKIYSGEVELDQVCETLRSIEASGSVAQADYIYRKEDSDYLEDILAVSLLMATAIYYRGLLTCGRVLDGTS